jgi:hypothetical protein
MHTRHCLKLAARIDALLVQELGQGIDCGRMVVDPLYARDVLLVCDAHREGDLPMLAHRYRYSAAAPEATAAEERGRSGFSVSGFLSSMFGPQSTLDSLPPMEDPRPTAPRRWFGRATAKN